MKAIDMQTLATVVAVLKGMELRSEDQIEVFLHRLLTAAKFKDQKQRQTDQLYLHKFLAEKMKIYKLLNGGIIEPPDFPVINLN